MDKRKNAIVTGASGGIGQATAIELARNGYDVYITYVSRKEGAEKTLRAVEDLGARGIIGKVDIRNLEEIDWMFSDFSDKLGTLDLLVNNGGIDRHNHFLETTQEEFDSIINANLRGAFFCTQKAARMMIGARINGVIINISSVQAEGNWPGYSVYAASKAALTKLTKSVAMELAAYGIRVVAIHPGYIDVGNMDHGEVEAISKRIPLGRIGTVEETANLVVFCASEKASYITGSALNVDGGVLLPVASENYFDGAPITTDK